MRAAKHLRVAAAVGLAVAAVAAAVPPASACACGIAIEADVPDEQALVTWDGRRETATVKLALENAGEHAAVLFPTPAAPEVDQPPGGAGLFEYLDEATRPPPSGSDGGDSAVAPAGGAVDVVERKVLGAYDVAVLRADDKDSLARWLRQNGYDIRGAPAKLLDSYVERGWHFVAIKLAEKRDGSLKPLRMSFAANKPVYPMELSSASPNPVSLRLYVNARRGVAATGIRGLKAVFDAPVSELDPAPPAAVRRLLTEPHVTRLEVVHAPPSSVDGDVRIRFAAAATESGDSNAVAWIALAAAVLTALALLLAWRRRAGADT